VPWAALVFDEAHYLKNHTSARSKLARQLTVALPRQRPRSAVQLLTGTPLTSRPRDLFVLLQLAAHPLGRSFLAFAKRYCAARKGDTAGRRGSLEHRGADRAASRRHAAALEGRRARAAAEAATWLPVAVPSGTGARAIKKVFELLAGKGQPADPVARRRASSARQAARVPGGGTTGARVRRR
jgi:hypothetical protein